MVSGVDLISKWSLVSRENGPVKCSRNLAKMETEYAILHRRDNGNVVANPATIDWQGKARKKSLRFSCSRSANFAATNVAETWRRWRQNMQFYIDATMAMLWLIQQQ